MATASEPHRKGHASGGTVTPDPAIPVEFRKDIALLWVEIDGDSEILREVGAGGSLLLPFAVCGTGNVEMLVRREYVPEIQSRALTLGVLLDCGDASEAGSDRVPTEAQSRGLIEWAAGTEETAPDRHALDGCAYVKAGHGTEIAAKVFRRADELFPENEIILTRRITTIWTYAELWRDISKNLYPGILDRVVNLFLERYVNGSIPPDPERGYAVYAGLTALRLTGREKEAVGVRFGRIAEAGLDGKELALVDLALGEDPRKPFGKDGPTVAELTGAVRNPSGQVYRTLILPGPILWPGRAWNEAAAGDSTTQRRLN